ncbi:MAG: hypothetical protein DRK00_01155, partial [Thermoprotei archaeon]
IKVATVGGVFRAGDVVIKPFKSYIEEHYKVEIVEPEFPPAIGALLLSYMLSGIEVSEEIVENIRRSYPKHKLYA